MARRNSCSKTAEPAKRDYLEDEHLDIERRQAMSIRDYDWHGQQLLGKSRCTKCAEVVKVARQRDGKMVAIRKMSSPVFPRPPDALEAYEEAQRLFRLPFHENLVRINAIFESENIVYLETDYYNKTLNAKIQRHFELRGAFSQSQLVRYMLQLVKAIRFLHKNNILHRDIKPKNIYVIASNDSVKLGDYGAPKLYQNRSHGSRYAGAFWWVDRKLDGHHSHHCCIAPVSSWPYMPPETMCELYRPKTAANTHAKNKHGDRYTVFSEAWSLGVVFFEMLTLKVPFSGRTPKFVQKAIIESTLPLSSVPTVRKYSGKLINFVRKLLVIVPEERLSFDILEKELGLLNQRSDVLRLSKSGDVDDMKKLFVDNKVDVNVKDVNGFTPLMHATSLGNIEMVNFLLKNGADAGTVSKHGWQLEDCLDENDGDPDTKFLLDDMLTVHRQKKSLESQKFSY